MGIIEKIKDIELELTRTQKNKASKPASIVMLLAGQMLCVQTVKSSTATQHRPLMNAGNRISHRTAQGPACQAQNRAPGSCGEGGCLHLNNVLLCTLLDQSHQLSFKVDLRPSPVIYTPVQPNHGRQSILYHTFLLVIIMILFRSI